VYHYENQSVKDMHISVNVPLYLALMVEFVSIHYVRLMRFVMSSVI